MVKSILENSIFDTWKVENCRSRLCLMPLGTPLHPSKHPNRVKNTFLELKPTDEARDKAKQGTRSENSFANNYSECQDQTGCKIVEMKQALFSIWLFETSILQNTNGLKVSKRTQTKAGCK